MNHSGLITVFILPWTERDKTNPGIGRQEGCDAEGEVIQLIWCRRFGKLSMFFFLPDKSTFSSGPFILGEKNSFPEVLQEWHTRWLIQPFLCTHREWCYLGRSPGSLLQTCVCSAILSAPGQSLEYLSYRQRIGRKPLVTTDSWASLTGTKMLNRDVQWLR